MPVEEVVYFQSDEKYTTVVTVREELVIRKPVKELEQELTRRNSCASTAASLSTRLHRAHAPGFPRPLAVCACAGAT